MKSRSSYMQHDDLRWRLNHIRAIAKLMDGQFSVFGFRFGLDALGGLIPGIGDFITSLVGLYVIWHAHLIGVPNHLLGKMMMAVLLDFFLGSIPIIGDIIDFFFPSVHYSVKLTERYLETKTAPQ